MADLSKLNFLSSENYMKRHPSTDHRNVTAGAGATTTFPVLHGQTFIPQFEVSGEVDGDGIIWARNKLYVGMEGATAPSSPEITAWVDEQNLTISLYNPTVASVTRTIYYVIYKDYGKTTN